MPAYEYPATVIKVVDGDTIKMSVRLRRTRMQSCELGFHIYVEDGWLTIHESLRLLGLNAAEHGTLTGDAATAYAKAWLAAHPAPYTVRTVKDAQEKYGRYLATVVAGNGDELNADLVRNHYALPWDGVGTRPV